VTDALIELLNREAAAMELVESRLRTLELLAAADEHWFVTTALDELEAAAERLSALELVRCVSLTCAGYSPELTASQLVAELDRDGEPRVGAVVEGLRAAAERLTLARDRAAAAVAGGRDAVLSRLEAAGELVGM
jgi:hypothetical protein